jgi:general secretion pathway protein H
MRTSATGAWSRPRGFTLFELLVVVAIIGIMILASATLAFGDRAAEVLERESERLAALIRLAHEEAVLQSRERAVGFWRGGYAFLELDGGDWRVLEEDSSLRPRELPEPMRVELLLEGIDTVLSVNPRSEPQAFLLSSGEATTFELRLELEDATPWLITVDPLGEVEARRVEDPFG